PLKGLRFVGVAQTDIADEAPPKPINKGRVGEGTLGKHHPLVKVVLTLRLPQPSSSGPRAFGLSGANPDEDGRRRQVAKKKPGFARSQRHGYSLAVESTG